MDATTARHQFVPYDGVPFENLIVFLQPLLIIALEICINIS